MEYNFDLGGEIKTVSIEPEGDRFRVTIEDQVFTVAVRSQNDGRLSLEIEGRRWTAQVASQGEYRFVAAGGDTWRLKRMSRREARRRRGGTAPDIAHGHLQATMPGQVLDVLVAEGDQVARGQTLVLLEAMKMELRLTAPYDGHVQRIHCVPGQVVERGQMLVEVEEG